MLRKPASLPPQKFVPVLTDVDLTIGPVVPGTEIQGETTTREMGTRHQPRQEDWHYGRVRGALSASVEVTNGDCRIRIHCSTDGTVTTEVVTPDGRTHTQYTPRRQ